MQKSLTYTHGMATATYKALIESATLLNYTALRHTLTIRVPPTYFIRRCRGSRFGEAPASGQIGRLGLLGRLFLLRCPVIGARQ